jgi:hypothetical protein
MQLTKFSTAVAAAAGTTHALLNLVQWLMMLLNTAWPRTLLLREYCVVLQSV